MAVSGGGQLTQRPHLLSRDGRLVLVCVGSAVRVHSAATAEQLLTVNAHSDEVTCLALHPSEPGQVPPHAWPGPPLRAPRGLQAWEGRLEAQAYAGGAFPGARAALSFRPAGGGRGWAAGRPV